MSARDEVIKFEKGCLGCFVIMILMAIPIILLML